MSLYFVLLYHLLTGSHLLYLAYILSISGIESKLDRLFKDCLCIIRVYEWQSGWKESENGGEFFNGPDLILHLQDQENVIYQYYKNEGVGSDGKKES